MKYTLALPATAAVVAARLSVTLEAEMGFQKVNHYYWTDSEIVLGYLRNESKRFKIFVANRVQEIQGVSRSHQWRHISGSDNPADLASRGMKASALINSSLWYHGPQFLSERKLVLEEVNTATLNPDDVEICRVTTNVVNTDDNLDIYNFSLFSSWKSLCRGVARAKFLAGVFKNSLSIKNRLRSSGSSHHWTPLEVADLQAAECLVVRAVQGSYFSQEISNLLTNVPIAKNSGLHRLNCFMDDSGLLRVGGKLRFTNLYSCYKYPILLPKGAHISLLIIRECHESVKHQGRGLTINEVRSRGFWIVGLNNQVKSLIHDCVTCRILRGKTTTQKMADLPTDRADCVPPFTYCGVDLFGPFLVKERRSEVKRYGTIFTCLSSRAVHVEMTYALTTDSFIQSLRKFMAIRCPVRLLRCDNGTNFVGANRELAKSVEIIQDEALRSFLINNKCDLKFKMNPPSASHMGGAWERLIGVVRSVLSALLEQHSGRLDDSA